MCLNVGPRDIDHQVGNLVDIILEQWEYGPNLLIAGYVQLLQILKLLTPQLRDRNEESVTDITILQIQVVESDRIIHPPQRLVHLDVI